MAHATHTEKNTSQKWAIHFENEGKTICLANKIFLNIKKKK